MIVFRSLLFNKLNIYFSSIHLFSATRSFKLIKRGKSPMGESDFPRRENLFSLFRTNTCYVKRQPFPYNFIYITCIIRVMQNWDVGALFRLDWITVEKKVSSFMCEMRRAFVDGIRTFMHAKWFRGKAPSSVRKSKLWKIKADRWKICRVFSFLQKFPSEGFFGFVIVC